MYFYLGYVNRRELEEKERRENARKEQQNLQAQQIYAVERNLLMQRNLLMNRIHEPLSSFHSASSQRSHGLPLNLGFPQGLPTHLTHPFASMFPSGLSIPTPTTSNHVGLNLSHPSNAGVNLSSHASSIPNSYNLPHSSSSSASASSLNISHNRNNGKIFFNLFLINIRSLSVKLYLQQIHQ